MFEDDKIKFIDNMKERDSIHYIWISLLIKAGKNNFNGMVSLNEDTAYTDEMLAIIFNRPVETVRFALKTLAALKMIDIDEDNFINIVNWEKHQNTQGMDKIREQNRLRKQKERQEKKKAKEESELQENKIKEAKIKESKNKLEEDKIEENNLQENENQLMDKAMIEEGLTGKELSNQENTNVIAIFSDEKNNGDGMSHDRQVDNTVEDTDFKEINFKHVDTCETMSHYSHADVTLQNKRENKRESKIKNKIENKNKREREETENKVIQCDKIIDSASLEDQSLSLFKKYKSIGNIKGLSVINLKSAIEKHGQFYVQMALDKAIELNKFSMTYVNGILKNWALEGYPKEVKSHGNLRGCNMQGESDFSGIKIPKPRTITESEMREIEKELI